MFETAIAFLATPAGQTAAIGAALAVGGLIVKITPTKTDDAWFEAIKRKLGRGK